MTLGDVLRVVGDSALSDFPWGRNVVLLVNGFTPDDTNLKTSCTGLELKAAMETVAAEHRTLLLNARVLIDDHQGMTCVNDAMISQVNASHKLRNLIVLGFALVLCLIAGVLTISNVPTEVITDEQTVENTNTVIEMLMSVLEKFKS